MRKKDEALKLILEEWLVIPACERATQQQAYVFAIQARQKYPFRSSADPHQVIMGMLTSHIGLP